MVVKNAVIFLFRCCYSITHFAHCARVVYRPVGKVKKANSETHAMRYLIQIIGLPLYHATRDDAPNPLAKSSSSNRHRNLRRIEPVIFAQNFISMYDHHNH